jgi:hypothetical protein
VEGVISNGHSYSDFNLQGKLLLTRSADFTIKAPRSRTFDDKRSAFS